MPIGIITNVLTVFIGGIIGTVSGKHVPNSIKNKLPGVFGLAAIMIGMLSVIKAQIVPIVVLSIIIGAVIGEIINLEKRVTQFFTWAIDKFLRNNSKQKNTSIDMEKYISIVTIFCVSGLGIFGALTEGMTGDASILLSKSILDFFTAIIFAALLGISVSLIAFPQLIIFMLLFFSARSILPFINDVMLANFTALGGIITIAVGMRVAEIKSFSVINLIPGLILVFPLTKLWILIF